MLRFFYVLEVRGGLMSKISKIVLSVAVAIVLALFIMLFMGLGDNPVVVPRAPL